MPVRFLRVAAAEGFQFRQRRGELQRRDQLQVLAVEQPQQHLQHVLPHRVLCRPEEHARVVARRRLEHRAGINRAAVGSDGNHQPVVADVVQVFDQPQAAVAEGVPVVQAAAAAGFERLRGGEVFRQQGAVHVGRQQASRRRRGDRRAGQMLPTGQNANLPEHGRLLLAAIRHHAASARWSAARRSGDASPSAARRPSAAPRPRRRRSPGRSAPEPRRRSAPRRSGPASAARRWDTRPRARAAGPADSTKACRRANSRPARRRWDSVGPTRPTRCRAVCMSPLASGSLAPPHQPRPLRQLPLQVPPPWIRRIDLDHLAQLARRTRRRRTPRIDHHNCTFRSATVRFQFKAELTERGQLDAYIVVRRTSYTPSRLWQRDLQRNALRRRRVQIALGGPQLPRSCPAGQLRLQRQLRRRRRRATGKARLPAAAFRRGKRPANRRPAARATGRPACGERGGGCRGRPAARCENRWKARPAELQSAMAAGRRPPPSTSPAASRPAGRRPSRPRRRSRGSSAAEPAAGRPPATSSPARRPRCPGGGGRASVPRLTAIVPSHSRSGPPPQAMRTCIAAPAAGTFFGHVGRGRDAARRQRNDDRPAEGPRASCGLPAPRDVRGRPCPVIVASIGVKEEKQSPAIERGTADYNQNRRGAAMPKSAQSGRLGDHCRRLRFREERRCWTWFSTDRESIESANQYLAQCGKIGNMPCLNSLLKLR